MIWHITVILLFLNGIFGQSQDLDFCDITKIQADPAGLKIPTVSPLGRYQALIERNKYGLTEEIKEYYDGLTNIGIAITTEASITTTSYAYFKINELLLIINKTCSVRKLNESINLTPFFSIVDQQGNQHIVSPLTIASRNLTFVYIGSSSSVRGIPVNEWQTCAYSNEEKLTYRITVSFSNPNKWSPADPSPDFPSIPIQTMIETKGQNDDVKIEYFSNYKYKSGLTLKLEDYVVPSGVFCPGRTNLKPLPSIPKSFSFSNQLSETIEEIKDMAGKVEYYRESYDYDNKLFRFDLDRVNVPFTEIHDFTTGLNYIINRKTGLCTIEKLKAGQLDSQSNGTYVEIRDPASFFDFDGGEYHWIGFKRQDGVNTDVWIGKRVINGVESIVEWYFLADQWNNTDFNQNNYKTPIKFISYSKISVPNVPNSEGTLKVTNNIFNFRESELNLNEYDIRDCVDDLEKQSFSFTVSVDYTNVIKSNLGRFRKAVVFAIKKVASVVLLRITVPEVIFYSDFVIVTFQIYERSKMYGDVILPKDDLILKEAVQKLNDYFNNNNLEINFIDDLNKEVKLMSLPKSFNDHYESEGFISFNIEDVSNGFSSASIFVVTLTVTLIGILLGLVLIQLHKQNKIKIPLI